MNTTFGVTSTTGSRPVAVIAPMCHRSPPTSPVRADPNRPCNEPRAGVVFQHTQEPTVTLEDLTTACRDAASADTAQKASGRDAAASVNRNLPKLRTSPILAELRRTSLGASLLQPAPLETWSLGTATPGTSLIRTWSSGPPPSETNLTSAGVDSVATSRFCSKLDSGRTKDRRPASILALSSADKTLTSGVADRDSTACRKLNSGKTQDCGSDLSPTDTPVISVLISSSQPGDLSSALFRKQEDLPNAVDQCNFYYGNMTNTEAKSRLHGYSVGTFLLRDSSDTRFRYSLSVKTSRGTTSIRIAGRPTGLYRLDSDPHQESRMPAFRCILSLVEHYFLSASAATSTGEKGKRRSHCVLLESSGRYDTPMVLRKPLELSPAPLAHLCRRTINNRVPSVEDRRKLIDSRHVELSEQRRRSIQDYMLGYPFRV